MRSFKPEIIDKLVRWSCSDGGLYVRQAFRYDLWDLIFKDQSHAEYAQNLQKIEADYTKNGSAPRMERYWFAKLADVKNADSRLTSGSGGKRRRDSFDGCPGEILLFTEEYEIKIFKPGENSYRTGAPAYILTIEDLIEALNMTEKEFDGLGSNMYGRFLNNETDNRYICCSQPNDLLIAKAQFENILLDGKVRSNITFIDEAEAKKTSKFSACYPHFKVYPQGITKTKVDIPKDIKIIQAAHNELWTDFYSTDSTRHLIKKLDCDQMKTMNRKKDVGQKTVMGHSAKYVADKLGIDSEIAYEWLHLIAYSMGPARDFSTPQDARNMVLGTAASNSLMLEYETVLENLAVANGGSDYEVTVEVNIKQIELSAGKYLTWITKEIEYHYEVKRTGNPNPIASETIKFHPFIKIDPSVGEYLLFKSMFPVPAMPVAKALHSSAPNPEAFTARNLIINEYLTCTVQNNKIVTVEEQKEPMVLSAGASTLEEARSDGPVQEGESFAGKTSVLGLEDVLMVGARLNNGRSAATLDLKKEGFLLSDLFENVGGENLSFFLFDDMKMVIDTNEDDDPANDQVVISGNLRMDNEFLRPIKEFLKIEEGLYLSGSIVVGGLDLTQKIRPELMGLKSSAAFYLPIIDGVVLKEAALMLIFHREIDYIANTTDWTCSPTLSGKIELSQVACSPVVLDCNIGYKNRTLYVSAAARDVKGLFHIDGLNLNSMSLQFQVGRHNEIELTAYLSTLYKDFAFGGILSAQNAGMFAQAEDFTLDDLNDIFYDIFETELDLPEYDVIFDEVMLGLAAKSCTIGAVSLESGLTVACAVTVHGHTCNVKAVFSKDGISFTGGLGNMELCGVHISEAMLHLQLYSASSGKASEFSIKGSATFEGITVECKVSYEKLDKDWNCVIYAGLHAGSFGLSTIFKEAENTFVDSLKFSKAAFVYSSGDCRTQDPDYDFNVSKGLQLMGVLEEIPAISDLTGSKHVGLKLCAHLGKEKDIRIDIPDSRLELGSSVKCDPLRARIVFEPEASLDFVFGMDVTVPKQDIPLHFDLVLGIGLTEAKGSATMKNYWVEPFGIQGLKIGPALALQIGIIYATFIETGLPAEFGFAGGLALGDVEAQMALNISENPTHEILMGELVKLSPKNLVKLANTLTGLDIAEDVVPNFFEIQDLKIYCAPNGGSIGTIIFKPGFSFAARIVLFGKSASIYALVSDSGVEAEGQIEHLEIGPLKIGGKEGKDARLALKLTTAVQSVFIDGEIDFIGARVAVAADISNKGANFTFEEEFIGLKFLLTGKSQGSLSDPSSLDFLLAAEFENELTNYIKNTVAEKIHIALENVETALNEAESKVNDAEAAYLALFNPAQKALDEASIAADKYLRACQKKVKEEKERYTASLESAKNEVEATRRSYDNAMASARDAISQAQREYDSAMKNASAAVEQAQKDYNQAMDNAANAVSQAQRNYDSGMRAAESSLASAQRTVDSLRSQIDSATYELEHLSWYEFYKAMYLPAEIAGLWVAYGTATAALTVADTFLKGLRYGIEYGVLEVAKQTLKVVKTGAEYIALETAKATLKAVTYGVEYSTFEAAKQALTVVQYGTEYTAWTVAIETLNAVESTGRAALDAAELVLGTIGQSAAYIALEAARLALQIVKNSTAAIAFESAKAVLEGVKQGAGALLTLAEYVAKHIGDVIDIKGLKLSAHLKGIESGELFKAEIHIFILGTEYNWTLDFDIKNAVGFIEKLFIKALEYAESIIGFGNDGTQALKSGPVLNSASTQPAEAAACKMEGDNILYTPDWDKFVVYDSTRSRLLVVNRNGELFGHDLCDNKVGPIYRIEGEPVIYTPEWDQFVVYDSRRKRLLVANAKGELFGHDLYDNKVGPIYRIEGEPILYTPDWDRFVVYDSHRNRLLVVNAKGELFGHDLYENNVGATYRIEGDNIIYTPEWDQFVVYDSDRNRLLVVNAKGELFGHDLYFNKVGSIYRLGDNIISSTGWYKFVVYVSLKKGTVAVNEKGEVFDHTLSFT